MKKYQILAHRGFWHKKSEQNKVTALERALKNGFGIETDIRDCNERLVISHDMPALGSTVELRWLLETYVQNDYNGILALNIKSDGLSGEIETYLREFGIPADKYFVFDMSIPDTLSYVRSGLTTFSRLSEFEPKPLPQEMCKGVWVDSLIGEYPQVDSMELAMTSGYDAVLVSPELHGRAHKEIWGELRTRGLASNSRARICTDFPLEAHSVLSGSKEND